MNSSDIPDETEDVCEKSDCLFGCADEDTHRTICGNPGEFLMD